MTQDHENPICASLGHYVAGITLVFCPHHQGHLMMVRAGDESDDVSWRFERLDFGPFDSLDDVERRAHAEVSRLLRADRAAWVALQRDR